MKVIYTFFLYGLLLLIVTASAIAQPDTQIRGFTDVQMGYSAKDKKFQTVLGQFTTFITSEITDRISFLSEVVFEYSGHDAGIDIERVLIKYNFDTQFNLVLGKHHTPIGYWNTAYHHGAVIQPTICRPRMFSFEDNGGVLPIHTIGLMATGESITPLNIGYSFLVGSGVGSTAPFDHDDDKSFTLEAHIEPLEGLRVGASSYLTKVAKGSATLRNDTLAQDMNQLMIGGTLLYLNRLNSPFEFISEFLSISNKYDTRTVNTTSLYLYAGYRIGNIIPYVRYDQLRYGAKDDLFYNAVDMTGLLVGVRYEISYLSVLKLEFQNEKFGDTDAANKVMFQFAVGF